MRHSAHFFIAAIQGIAMGLSNIHTRQKLKDSSLIIKVFLISDFLMCKEKQNDGVWVFFLVRVLESKKIYAVLGEVKFLKKYDNFFFES